MTGALIELGVVVLVAVFVAGFRVGQRFDIRVEEVRDGPRPS